MTWSGNSGTWDLAIDSYWTWTLGYPSACIQNSNYPCINASCRSHAGATMPWNPWSSECSCSREWPKWSRSNSMSSTPALKWQLTSNPSTSLELVWPCRTPFSSDNKSDFVAEWNEDEFKAAKTEQQKTENRVRATEQEDPWIHDHDGSAWAHSSRGFEFLQSSRRQW